MRYEIVRLKRAKKGFRAVIVDYRHPSGVKSGIPVQWFETPEKAAKHLDTNGHKYNIIDEK